MSCVQAIELRYTRDGYIYSMTPNNHIVVLFDGVCNLCSGSVQFIIKRDARGTFKFASLQSAYAQNQLVKFQSPSGELYSIMVLENGVLYQRSDAILRILANLGGFWYVLSGFRIIPKFIRDAMYNLIAKNRYRIFGKKDQCMIPTPELNARFMD